MQIPAAQAHRMLGVREVTYIQGKGHSPSSTPP